MVTKIYREALINTGQGTASLFQGFQSLEFFVFFLMITKNDELVYSRLHQIKIIFS